MNIMTSAIFSLASPLNNLLRQQTGVTFLSMSAVGYINIRHTHKHVTQDDSNRIEAQTSTCAVMSLQRHGGKGGIQHFKEEGTKSMNWL
jgi:hypothetical protein